MNGIKEDIKAIGVLDCGSPAYQEALRNLSVRLKSLQVTADWWTRCKIVTKKLRSVLICRLYLVSYGFAYMAMCIKDSVFNQLWFGREGSNIICLQKHCKEHFEEEERDLLPLVEATELSTEQQKRTLAQCVSVMQGTHSRLFNFFLEGLTPEEAMQYLDLTTYAVIKNNLSPNFVWLFGKIDIYICWLFALWQ